MALDLTGQVLDNFLISQISDKIGTVKTSMLDEVSFNKENPGLWFLMDGRSAIGTQYGRELKCENIPDLVTNGEFLRQSKTATPGTKEGDAIRNITGKATMNAVSSAVSDPSVGALDAVITQTTNRYSYGGGTYYGADVVFNASWQVPTADENRPKNMHINFFIKVDY